MNYVFCGSYGDLFIALDLKKSGKEITIVTYSEDIKEYCITVNIKFIYFEIIRPGFRLTVNPITLIWLVMKALRDVVNLKNSLDTLIREINFREEDSFYILTRLIAYEEFYLAKKLAKKGKGTVYYSQIAWKDFKIYKAKFTRVFFENLFTKYLLRIFLGLDLIFYDLNSVPRYGINDKFFQKNNIIKIAHDRDYVEFILDIVKKTETGQKRYDNLLIGESSGIISIMKYDSIRNIYEHLADLPVEFVLKKHPKHGEVKLQIEILYEELFKNCEELSEYTPVELFLNNIRKNVIAIASTPLIVASQLDHLRAISLLELVEWYHESYKSEMRNSLIKASKNRIIFVKDFQELKEILTGSKA